MPHFSSKLIVKNVKKFPYNSVGTLIVKFTNEELEYTCFLIYHNIVITLASNLINKNGEKAKYIKTTFSNEEVKWENIFIEEDKKDKKNKNKNEIQIENENENSKKNNKLAGILYKNTSFEEYLGLKWDFKEKIGVVLNAVISYGYKINDKLNNNSENIVGEKIINQNEKKYEASLLEVKLYLNDETYLKPIEKKEDKEAYKRISGSTIMSFISYIRAIIDENYQLQSFDKNNILFVIDMIQKGKIIIRKYHADIVEDYINRLDL